ncbi:hypothetical protein [Burkholderia pseudomultivorans]|uniref:hypothetical protein n=1 Tax=Burkholderia pseudomultivorans TaxID=1207504 RepID=UPI0012D87F4C|nr:hypothetical protein [Burkholderia pseudomultivorans]
MSADADFSRRRAEDGLDSVAVLFILHNADYRFFAHGQIPADFHFVCILHGSKHVANYHELLPIETRYPEGEMSYFSMPYNLLGVFPSVVSQLYDLLRKVKETLRWHDFRPAHYVAASCSSSAFPARRG